MRKSPTFAAASWFARESVNKQFVDDDSFAEALQHTVETYGGVKEHLAHRFADLLDLLPHNRESSLDDAAWALDILTQTRSALDTLLENDRTLMESAQEDRPLTASEKDSIRRNSNEFDRDYLETTHEKNEAFRKGGDAYDHDGLDNDGTRASFYGVENVDEHEDAIRANANTQGEEREFLELQNVYTESTEPEKSTPKDEALNPKTKEVSCSESPEGIASKDLATPASAQSNEMPAAASATNEAIPPKNPVSENKPDAETAPIEPAKKPAATLQKTLKIKVPKLAALSPGEAFKKAMTWTMNCLRVITTGSNVPDLYPRLSPIIGIAQSPLQKSDDVTKILAELAKKFLKLRAPDAGDSLDDVFDGLSDLDPKNPNSMLDALEKLTDRLKRATGGTKSEFDATGGEGMSFKEGSSDLWEPNDDRDDF